MKRVRLGTIAGLFLFAALALADAEQLTTADFADVEKQAAAMGEKYGVDNVLMVFDIDNTLLATKQDLGSDQWFTWQTNLLADPKKAKPGELVAKDILGLLTTVQSLLSLSKMRPTQPNAPEIVKSLQEKGFKTVVLTARSPDLRDGTQGALQENGYYFIRTIGPDKGYPGSYIPYDPKDLEDTGGFTEEEAKAMGLGEPRPVSFQNGIFMGSGQHKGAMLRALLKKTDFSPKAILFSDDHEKHTVNMSKAYTLNDGLKKKVQLTTYRYSREDPNVKKFHAGSKTKVTSQWKRLKTVLNETFPK